MPRFVGWVIVLLAACAYACATPEAEPVDVHALAGEFEVEPDALRLYLRGYEQGYEDGEYRNAGMSAGTSLGNVPGPEGWGWRQGLEDGVNGVPMREPAQLAPILRDR